MDSQGSSDIGFGQGQSQLFKVQLNTPYLEGGWMERQDVYHIGDSQHNNYTRY